MNWKEYINSGLLELYVAGTLSAQEMARIRALEKEHPELAAEIDKIQQASIMYAQKAAGSFEMPEFDESAFESFESKTAENQDEKNVVVLEKKPQINAWLSIAAAVVLLVSISAALFFYLQFNTLKTEFSALRQKQMINDSLLAQQMAENHELEYSLSEMRSHFIDVQDHINDTETQKIVLKGLDLEPNANAIVLWNKNTEKVYVSASNLPAVDDAHQYQLWALVDGKPIDAGVFFNINELQNVKSIAQADAFAITLEPKGGSKSPTLEQLYVLGNVAINS
jgi:anti-sigma-K factor RskA